MTRAMLAALALLLAAPLAAQGTSPPERIDILVDTTPEPGPADIKACQDRQDAARISGEIVVCGKAEDNSQQRLVDPKAAEDRYAKATMFKDAPQTPDPCGPMCGIFKGPPTVGGICGIGLNPCPPPPAYFIDFASLPKAPPGSDADRIARGLPPIGNEKGTDPASGEKPVSRSESASPAAAPSG